MMTKIIEGLLIGILSGVISGAAGLYVGVKLLERDIDYQKLRFQEHVVEEKEPERRLAGIGPGNQLREKVSGGVIVKRHGKA